MVPEAVLELTNEPDREVFEAAALAVAKAPAGERSRHEAWLAGLLSTWWQRRGRRAAVRRLRAYVVTFAGRDERRDLAETARALRQARDLGIERSTLAEHWRRWQDARKAVA
jgi:Uma2 family endonuclease